MARAILITFLLVALVGALVFWRWYWPPDEAVPLAANWSASVATIAGDGQFGAVDGVAHAARFSEPFGLALATDGRVYIADAGDSNAIRVIGVDGRVSTLATGFSSPSALSLDKSGQLYVADTGNNTIKRVGHDGTVTTLGGGFNAPVGVAVDATGRVIVADTYNDRICIIETDGTMRPLVAAGLDTPSGVAVDDDGIIYIADTGHNSIQYLGPDGTMTPIDLTVDLFRPVGITTNGRGTVYVTDERGRIVETDRAGRARIVAGSKAGFGDGPGEEARFRRPSGIAFASAGRLIVADSGNALVRRVEAASHRTFVPAPPLLTTPAFDAGTFGLEPLLWPIAPMDGPYEIAGTHGEARGGEGADRFHAGIDIRAEAGTPVHAVRGGVVSAPVATDDFLSLNEWLRIGSVAYVHVRAGRDARGRLVDNERFVPSYDEKGRLTRVRIKRGARFVAGDTIGSVNPFNHVHLNVGWPGEEINPLRLRLPLFEDSIAPTIGGRGVRLYDEAGTRLPPAKDGPIEVSGRVQIVVDAFDQADGNRPERRLGVYELGYQVLRRDGTPTLGFEQPRTTIRFDSLAADENAPRLVYAPGSGIPFYGRRTTRFLYVVTNSYRAGVAARGAWDTALLPPGDYLLRVRAADARGNETVVTTRIVKR